MTTVVTSSLESRARASPRVVARRPRRAFDGRVPDKTNPSHSRAAGTSASSSRARAVSDPREDVAGNPFEQSSDAADERRVREGAGGRVVATTVIENAALLHEQLLQVEPTRFLPGIPNLPYQYAVYTNFDAPRLAEPNAEVPHDPDALIASQRGAAAKEAAARAAEAPVRGGDFEAMLAAALAAEGGAAAAP